MQAEQYRGQTLVASDGEKIGTIEDVYVDNATEQPEWALVHTGLFGNRQTFVPLTQASPGDGQVTVPYSRTQVKDAPSVDADRRGRKRGVRDRVGTARGAPQGRHHPAPERACSP